MLGLLLFLVFVLAAILVSPWFLLLAVAFILLQAWVNTGTGRYF